MKLYSLQIKLKTFDKNFNGTNFNEEVLLYFPEIDQYIAPEYYALRLGLTPAVLIGNEGLFLKAKIGKQSCLHIIIVQSQFLKRKEQKTILFIIRFLL